MNKQRKDHVFSSIPAPSIQRSVFDRSHTYKSTFDANYLIPFYCDEVVPGDSFKITASTFCRLNTPIVPIMDSLYLDTFFFFVPSRLVWKNFKKFMGEQKKPDDSIDYTIPTFKDETVFTAGSLGDYFGLPTGVKLSNVNCLPFRAYNLIYNEWFRDENLIDSVVENDDDGKDDVSDYAVLKRAKRHDYFTSCLPWPQKGPGVDLPLVNEDYPFAPVIMRGTAGPDTNPQFFVNPGMTNHGSSDVTDMYNTRLFTGPQTTSTHSATSSLNPLWSTPSGDASFVYDSYSYPMVTNLTGLGSVTINSLRTAFQLQKFLEACSRGGTRYTEIIRSHFGVVSPDARLQRPEFLGGKTSRININPVVQTSSTDSTSPQGNLSAYGVSGDSTNVMSRSFTEHGYIIGLVNVRCDQTYQQGLNRMWSRRTRYDFYWPTFAHLGEQAVLNKEIFAQDETVVDSDGNVVNDNVFGYQERYAEYRYYPSQITGKFRSTYSQPLDSWHLAQYFSTLPTLSKDFIEENVPLDRCVAVPSEPDILFDSFIDVKAARPMPLYSVPGLVDHF